jgi:hypothetical protein
LEKRLRRLQKIAPEAARAKLSYARIPTGGQLLIRRDFVARNDPADVGGDWSDRALPPRHERPPASRLISPRGIALRFYLIALFVAQSRSAGERPGNLIPINDRDAEVSWVDLVAPPADRGQGNQVVSVRDQKVRQVHEALRRLASPAVELVALPQLRQRVGRYEKFLLLREAGASYGAGGEANERYTVPDPGTGNLLRLPPPLFFKGWIHVLEDTELALLLMIAALHARYGQDRQVYLDGDTRLLQFGIGRDAYQAHHQLQRFGLIDVEVDASRDHFNSSRVTGFTANGPPPKPHRFRLLPDGFDQPAIETVAGAIEGRLGRRAGV